MDKQLILALDIGTSSVRASLYDAEANPVRGAFAKIERTLTVTTDGGAEIDADEAVAQVVDVIDALLEKSRTRKAEISWVAASAFWHSLVGVDDKGKPTTRVLGWADTRSRRYTEIFRARFNERETHCRTGARFHSSFWPAKLMWLRAEFPVIFAKTERWLSFSDYLALSLFGESTTSVSMASGTGIFDIRRCVWDAELTNFLKLNPASMPIIADTDSQTFTLNNKYSKRWPRLAKAKWFPAIADGAADNIGAGCFTKSQAALMVGTSGAMRVAYEGEPPAKIPDGLWCYRIDRNRVILGGALSDGGGLYRWLERTLILPKDAEACLASRLPGGHGLTFLPFLAGERSTGYNEHAAGSILGLSMATEPIDILHAALESVAFRFGEIFAQLNSVVEIKTIAASGGALRSSPAWTHIIADVLGRELSMNSVAESSSRGAVLLALESIGKIDDIKQTPTHGGELIGFDQARSDLYLKIRKRYADAYNLLTT